MIALVLGLAIGHSTYVPKDWKDLPKRIDHLVSIVRRNASHTREEESDGYSAGLELAVIGKSVIPKVLPLINQGPKLNWTAIQVLESLRATEAIPRLRDLLAQTKQEGERWSVLRAIGNIGGPQAASALISALAIRTDDADNDLRRIDGIGDYLALLHDLSAIEPLCRLLNIDDQFAGKVEAKNDIKGFGIARLLSEFGPSIVQDVKPYLSSRSRTTRLSAALALALVGDASGKELLLELASGDNPHGIAGEAINGLIALHDPQMITWATDRLKKNDLDVAAEEVLLSFPATAVAKVVSADMMANPYFWRYGKPTDLGWGPYLEGAYHRTWDYAQENFFCQTVCGHALPTNLDLIKKQFEEKHYREAAVALAKLDPAYLMKFIGTDWNALGHICETALGGDYPPLRDYLVAHASNYRPEEYISYLASFGDPRDEDTLLRCLDNPDLKFSAMWALLSLRHCNPMATPWGDAM